MQRVTRERLPKKFAGLKGKRCVKMRKSEGKKMKDYDDETDGSLWLEVEKRKNKEEGKRRQKVIIIFSQSTKMKQ